MATSLWGVDFNIEPTPKKAKKITEKLTKPKSSTKTSEKKFVNKKLNIDEKLELIRKEVFRILGSYKENTVVIKTKEALHEYISAAIDNGEIAIDTETNNSLDPITCKLMGPCIYTPKQKNAYIPINHIDRISGERLSWQLTEADVAEEFSRLTDTKIIMHNGKFDYQVIKCTCNLPLKIYWDTMIGAKILDENEKSAGLKQQYITKIDPSIEKYDIEHLFDIEYAIVDPELFALYAATDAYMTYMLYKYQKDILQDISNSDLKNLFFTIEMPLVEVIAEMELNGMEVDQEYAKLLSDKYHKKLDKVDLAINSELDRMSEIITSWRLSPEANKKESKVNKRGESVYSKSKNEQLTDPINLSSPTQLAILFYDILKCPTIDKKQPRGTGEDILVAIRDKLNLPICDLILERRELIKLLTTYIDAIPEMAKNWPDGRVRTHFNQYGAATGRLSSSNPINFQNIPSHNKEIRMLFKAKDGYKIIGSDFSGQEPRLTAFYSQDKNMIDAYATNRDLYSVIASLSFDVPYEDCLEFYPEGTEIIFEGKKVICGKKTHKNKAGKARRDQAKSVLLGVLYGRGAKSVGEQIGKSRDEAQAIIDKFYNTFPAVKKWIDESIKHAHDTGYVTDIAGRHRRLPDILLDKYEFKRIGVSDFNPLLFTTNKINLISDEIKQKYLHKLSSARSAKDINAIKTSAEAEGIHIHDNTGFIAQAERQAVNSRVQGGAASLTKAALIRIYHDDVMKNLGARLINTVHDEILVEAPEEVSEQVAERLTSLMVESARQFVTNVPMSCDPYIVSCWYVDEFFVVVESEYKALIEKGLTDIEAFEELCKERTESRRDQIYEIVQPFMKNIPPNIER